MQILAAYAHRPVWPLPDLANFPSIPSLTTCVNLYLAHFAVWLPVVDSPRGSFRVDKAAPILLMAMATVGAVYESGGLEKLAFPLDELVRRQIVYIVSLSLFFHLFFPLIFPLPLSFFMLLTHLLV